MLYIFIVDVASTCVAPYNCTTVFTGPLGLAASFNRTVWLLKGKVIGTEMRAYNNEGVSRHTNEGKHDFIGITGML